MTGKLNPHETVGVGPTLHHFAPTRLLGCLGTSSHLTMVCAVTLVASAQHSRTLGNAIPSIAFGTWTLGNGQGPIDQVEQAFSVGFSHIGAFILTYVSIYRNRVTG